MSKHVASTVARRADDMNTDKRQPLTFPLVLPQPCPICGERVELWAVTEWEADDGDARAIEYECVTAPHFDADEWWDWFHGHYRMPYVDWLPWERKVLAWLNCNYHNREGGS